MFLDQLNILKNIEKKTEKIFENFPRQTNLFKWSLLLNMVKPFRFEDAVSALLKGTSAEWGFEMRYSKQ